MPESAIRDLNKQLLETARRHVAYSQVADFMNHINNHLSALAYAEEVRQKSISQKRKATSQNKPDQS